MYNNQFKLYNEVLKYSRYIRQYVLPNIPSVHRDLRIHMMDEVYNLLRNLVSAESTKGNIRMKYITEMIINIKLLDILSSDIRDYCPKCSKHINKSISFLTIIRNMTYGWRESPEPSEIKNDDIYYKAVTYENVIAMWNIVRKTCKNKKAIYKYDLNENILNYNLYLILLNNLYKPLPFRLFLIFEPKARLVMSQTVTDKIVNHFVANYYLIPYLENKLIDSNVATRKNKGSRYADKLINNYINKIRIKYPNNDIYVLKIDISKYFYTISHDILIDKLSKVIKDNNVINIIKNIISETNKPYINKTINYLNNKYNTNIPYYEKDV